MVDIQLLVDGSTLLAVLGVVRALRTNGKFCKDHHDMMNKVDAVAQDTAYIRGRFKERDEKKNRRSS